MLDSFSWGSWTLTQEISQINPTKNQKLITYYDGAQSMSKIEEIEGVGPAYAEKLGNAGITTVEGLLKEGAEKSARKAIAEKSEISESLILNWVNKADLCRINGVSTQYADLLEEAGVDTVPELAQRNAANLTDKMKEVNDAKNLVRKCPSLGDVEKWVGQAKDLPRVVNY